MDAEQFGGQRRNENYQQQQGQGVFTQRSPLAIGSVESPEKRPYSIEHQQGEKRQSGDVQPQVLRARLSPHDDNDIGQDAPAGDVIDSGAGNRQHAQLSVEHIAIFEDARQDRECGDAHGRTHEQSKTCE